MGRQGRTLLIIGVMGIVSVVALMWLADRYGKVLEQRAPRSAPRAVGSEPPTVATLNVPSPPREAAAPTATPEEQALAYLDAFLAVREAMRAALEEVDQAGPAERLAILETTREAALEAHELDPGEYRQICSLWRGWRAESRAPTRPFEQAFRARGDRLAAADLGAMEAFD